MAAAAKPHSVEEQIADLERRVKALEEAHALVGHPEHVRQAHLAEMAEPRAPRK